MTPSQFPEQVNNFIFQQNKQNKCLQDEVLTEEEKREQERAAVAIQVSYSLMNSNNKLNFLGKLSRLSSSKKSPRNIR